MKPTLKQLIETGRVQVIEGKLYARCEECGDVIRLDKPIIGSLHICAEKKENK